MKKSLILLISVVVFFLLLFMIVPVLIENELKKEDDKKELIIEEQVEEFLNKDNLYENYSHNYTIKIPENYKQDKGIGKYSSVQFYNEDLRFVVSINVMKKDFGNINNNKLLNKLKEDPDFLGETMSNSLKERGFIDSKLTNTNIVNYNNREFLKLEFNSNRISDNEKNPSLITIFTTYYNDFIYMFQFVSYDINSIERWNTEIQKSMSNVIISKYITKKNNGGN